MEPKFQKFCDGTIRLGNTDEAKAFGKGILQKQSISKTCQPAAVVCSEATEAVQRAGGDVGNQKHVLGQYKMQFGKYRLQTFQWVLENALGYAAWLVDNMRTENLTQANLSKNKHAFKKYINLFAGGKEAVEMKRVYRLSQRSSKCVTPGPQRPSPGGGVTPGPQRPSPGAGVTPQLPTQATVNTLYALYPPDEARRRHQSLLRNMRPAVRPNVSLSRRPARPDISDEALLAEVGKLEATITSGKCLTQNYRY
jgi:hypothetical protein